MWAIQKEGNLRCTLPGTKTKLGCESLALAEGNAQVVEGEVG